MDLPGPKDVLHQGQVVAKLGTPGSDRGAARAWRGEGRLGLTEQAARGTPSEGPALFPTDPKGDAERVWKYRDDVATGIEFGVN